MAYSMETLLSRLEKKNKAIAERAAITMKHSKLVLKKVARGEERDLYNVDSSAEELRYLLEEKREILKLIADAKKNEIILPVALDNYRKELEANLIRDRKSRREHLCAEWENHYRPLVEQDLNDIFEKFVNGEYSKITHWNYKRGHYIKDDDFNALPEQDKDEWRQYKVMENAWQWKKDTEERRNETDEHIEKRSAKDAKDLVEDIYKRVFGYTGEVTNCDYLRISCDNQGFSILNGVVEGVNGKCEVESISAGGYNIQCWHIRVLVKPCH